MGSFSVRDGRGAFDQLTGEVTGALGDSVTVLPIVFAVGTLSELSLGTALLGFAVFQVVWGVHYGVPVSVEPMKALAALVIAGGLTAGEFALAGLLAGGALLLAGRTGALGRFERLVGRPVVRGVQLAVALLLLETGVGLGVDAPLLAIGAAIPAMAAVAVGRRRVVPLLVLGVGGAVALARVGVPAFTPPVPSLELPLHAAAGGPAVVGATVGQLAMTVGNAAVATSLLLSDYYGADVSADELATSMGAMNLVAVPLGAIPMCHGSGGVAGKYAFGARTAVANVVLGAGYAAAALFAVDLASGFPLAVLGVVLAVVAVELGRTSLDTEHLGIVLFVGVVGVLTNVGIGFVAGLVVHAAIVRLDAGERQTA